MTGRATRVPAILTPVVTAPLCVGGIMLGLRRPGYPIGVRLRTEVEIDSLTDDLVGVVETSLQPAHLSLWLARAETSGGSAL